jgi:GrpB-like predicted nucleotidyltransferase (UPF0157 family)
MTGSGLTFVPSDSIAAETAAVFAAHAERIRQLLPQVEVRHHGGSAVPGLVTSGDVDIHVRADAQSFPAAQAALSGLYEPVLLEKWDGEVAYLRARDANPPVEVVLTLTGSLDDRFHKDAWERILADPALVARYNALKLDRVGGEIDDYKTAKREFFWEVVRSLDEPD